MRIQCNLIPDGKDLIPFISVYVMCRKPQFRGKMEFMIDSGSNRTVISERVADSYKIPFSSLEETTPSFGISGKLHMYIIKKVKFLIRKDSDLFRIMVDKIYVARNPRKDEDSEKSRELMPNLLGRDFLKNYGFSLHMDLKKEICYLEKE